MNEPDPSPDCGAVVVLGGSQRGRLVLGCALMILVGIVVLRVDIGFPLVYGVAGAAGLAYRWGDHVRLEEDALVVDHRGRCRRYRWDELLELSWSEAGPLSSGPVARTVGTVWDTPGPAAAAQLGRVLSPRRHAEPALREAAARHGVPYTIELLAVLAKGRLPRLPSDAARQAAVRPRRP